MATAAKSGPVPQFDGEEKMRVVRYICAELEKKRALSRICAEDEGMPGMSLFLGWVAQNAEVSEQYASAREAQIAALLEEGLEIAEEATDDAYIWTDPKTKRQYARLSGSSVKRAQLRINTRERFAQLMLPHKYGTQRMDVTSAGKALAAPVQINDNRIQALLQLAAHRAAQLSAPIDVTPVTLDDIFD